MRAIEGQHSDSVAIKRTREQKQLLLRQLKEQFASLKPTVAETMRAAMAKRIADLETELAAKTPDKSKGNAPQVRTGQGSPRRRS
ncbi:MAG TPA: hypothetical protein VEB64_16965 [Azospirillaceae bacterium]|nr:hypothetical protein [Azospirillaceae bacterium]